MMLTIKEIAARLHVHPDTVRRMIRGNKLKAIKLGYNMPRIKEEELERYLRERELQGAGSVLDEMPEEITPPGTDASKTTPGGVRMQREESDLSKEELGR